MREKIIAGNWKMNLNRDQAIDLILGIDRPSSATIVVCPPFTLLQSARDALDTLENNIELGAQNMHQEQSGAFTGEIAAKQLRDWGVSYVILGHSERRNYFNETDETVNAKVKTALELNYRPIVCVGEASETREAGSQTAFVSEQVKKALLDVHPEDFDQVVFAYEPIWAIGTGQTATPEQADEMIGEIRKQITASGGHGENNAILYGGSMNEKNARDLMAMENIDGGLIGGASLHDFKFNAITQWDR